MCILALVVVSCSAAVALGVPVDPNNPNGIVAIVGNAGWPTILCADGAPYIMQIAVESGRVDRVYWDSPSTNETGPVPVPIADILDWTPRLLQTRSGTIYVYDGNNEAWYDVSPGATVELAPCQELPIGISPTSLGALRSMFR